MSATETQTGVIIMALVGMASCAILWHLGQRLIAEVRELVQRVTRQEERLESLTGRVVRMESQMEAERQWRQQHEADAAVRESRVVALELAAGHRQAVRR
jgi:TolA-binding protein